VIRDAGPDDRRAIEAVTLAAYEQYASVLGPALWLAYRENIVTTLADPGPAAQLVAEASGEVVGTVLLYPAGATFDIPGREPVRLGAPEVRLLAVAPAARGAATGRALMEACIRRARDGGAATITLHTTEMMQTAMRLYERMGFERAPETDVTPAPGLLVKRYRLRLD